MIIYGEFMIGFLNVVWLGFLIGCIMKMYLLVEFIWKLLWMSMLVRLMIRNKWMMFFLNVVLMIFGILKIICNIMVI